MGPSAIGFVLGIVKAYTTRVGEGPFPTELTDATGQRLGERGHEFGTVTGRKRRCGWFDAVLVRQTCAISGVKGIALTKLDVLDGFETLKICTGYRIGGTVYDYLPTAAALQARVEPIYEELDGWSEVDAGRPALGRPAGGGGEVRPPHRGADPVPGGDAVDQPRARRHDPRHRSVRRLMALRWKTRRRLALLILVVGLPLYIIAAVSLVGLFDRPSMLTELGDLCRAGRGLGAAAEVGVPRHRPGRARGREAPLTPAFGARKITGATRRPPHDTCYPTNKRLTRESFPA